MIASEPTSAEGQSGAPVRTGSEADVPEGPVTTLRGAGVDVDPRRAGQLVLGVALVALAVVAVVLLVAGIQKNAQSDSLQHHGVAVDVTVSGCSGLLGGSGSNAAGYRCQGSYTFGGRHYERDIPGNSSVRRGDGHPRGDHAGRSGPLSTPAMVAAQQASWRVYLVPAILFAVLAVVVVTAVLTTATASSDRISGHRAAVASRMPRDDHVDDDVRPGRAAGGASPPPSATSC